MNPIRTRYAVHPSKTTPSQEVHALKRLFFLSAISCAFAGIVSVACARETTLLESGWRFTLGDGNGPGVAQPTFDDRQWQSISIPHCWGWEQAQKGESYYRGPGWYRRELNFVPRNGKRYFVRFDAASSVANVYLNGKLLGEHRGAFGAFCFEITTNLSPAGTNLLAVRVNNAAEPDVAPLSGDFPVYGGLYRPVHLIETSEECFSLTDHASPGVAWLQTSVTTNQAMLDVTTQISNGSKQKSSLILAVKVLDADGNEIVATNQIVILAPNTTAPYWAHLTVPNPHLWNGRKDPYLYQAKVELRSTNNPVDIIEQPLGLRFYQVDPANGFFLNGKPYPIHGVCRHQDRPDKGWAISPADMDEDITLINEIGATAVRCSHYQQSDYFYSLCDREGILVWAEIPQVDRINSSLAFEQTSYSQLIDLIRQNINHSSIFAWSLFNEIGNGPTDDPHRELQDLDNVAHSEDPTRPTIGATMTGNFPQMNKIPDLLGWNRYPWWYAKNDFEQELKSLQTTSRSGGICISEYGAGANVDQHEQNPHQPQPGGKWHPEEWQAIVHERTWEAIKGCPFVWGTFVWNMFDFTSYWRDEGGVRGRNDKGLITYDRKIRKDAFYFYKANWSDEPVIYITSRRFTQRTNAVTDVKIYSNATAVELSVNGISQGVLNDSNYGVFIWKGQQLRPGENIIEATAKRSGVVLNDKCVWTFIQ